MSVNHIWSAPARPLDASSTLRSIRAQHVQIRALLEKAQGSARAALEGQPQPLDAVASSIGDIRTTIEVHLAFEEKTLIPLLDLDLPLGPERARRLLDEHRRQRQLLAVLHQEALHAPELPTLSVKLEFLISWLNNDMDEEEEHVLISDVIREDQINIDQTSG